MGARVAFRIAVFAILSVAAPACAAGEDSAMSGGPKTPEVEAVAKELDTYLKSRQDFSGAVLVRHGDEVLLRAGYGKADYELGVPNSPGLIYLLGSVTKPFTATAVLHAYEADLLTLGQSVCDFLEPCPEGWTEATVHHLLNHTSGIPDLFGALDAVDLDQYRTEIDRVVGGQLDSVLRDPPGTAYEYSNFNYMLLGYVLEVASGRGWESYLTDQVLTGGENIRYDDVWSVVEDRVGRYAVSDGAIVNIRYRDHGSYAAGGLYSTLDDLAAWHDALMAGRILAPETLKLALTPHGAHYGYGWQVLRLLGRPAHNHTGGTNGATSHIAFYPDEDLLVIVLNNVEDADAKATACDLARLVLGAELSAMTAPDWLEKSTADRCAPTP